MYSNEHIKYLKQIKKENLTVKLIQLLIVILCIVIWQLLADFKVINTFILSSPKNIFIELMKLYNNGLIRHLLVTLYETILSFIIGTFLGIIISSFLWWNKFIAKIIDPFLTMFNSLPKVALGPILIIWTGANIKSIIIMALLISTFTTIITVYESFQNTNTFMIKLLKSMHASKKDMFKYLVLPYSYKTIISSLKINISMSLVGVIMGEMLVSKEGLGYLIVYGSQIFNLNLVIASIIILCIISVILYYILIFIELKKK